MRMRKKKNGEKRMKNLSKLFVDFEVGKPLDIERLFGNSDPVRLEIGCGKGDFIRGISESEPGFNYIALEKIGDVALAAAEKYATAKGLGGLSSHGEWLTPDGVAYDGEVWDIPCDIIGNVRFVCADAADFMGSLPDGCIDKIYTNFSDPWPKKGYVSRRLSSTAFSTQYKRILRDGGELSLKTDNDVYFEYSLEALSENGFEIIRMTRDIDSDPRFSVGNIETEYEKNFKEQGIKIKALTAVEKGTCQ